jgi:hypothetical protein
MSKFLRNLCVQISKALVYSKIQFYLKRNFPHISAHPAQPRPHWPTSPRRLSDPRSAHSAQAALAYLPKGVFPSTLRIPVETPSLSHITTMWGPPVSFIPFPMPADPLPLLLIASDHPAPPGLQPRDAK